MGADPPRLEFPPDLDAFLREAMIKAKTVSIYDVSTGVMDEVKGKAGDRLPMLPVSDHPI